MVKNKAIDLLQRTTKLLKNLLLEKMFKVYIFYSKC